MPENIVEISKMSFAHENGNVVFQDVDIVIPRGKITAIMGPSGTGKTTLLRLIGGQLTPTKGEITVAGKKIHQLSWKELYRLRKRMGMLFQSGGLFTHLNVFENVAFPLREHTKLSESMVHTLVLMKLQMVGLRGAAYLMPSELSGGMARRVALARAIALDPEIIMYDEPFTGQDPISMGVLVKLIRTLNGALNMTSIIVSHDVQETLSISDYVYVISGNKIIGQGTPEEITHKPSAQLQQFIQGLPDGPVPFDYPAKPLQQDFLEGLAT
ncbi:ABC transporter ATP-binding protein [Aquicella lusitana]|uniref:Phospholipid/cholesterol/gamma-HCH transport system ATP-binding protein n=1 Tax=Aquicella lusitana TaxID=254246 RepID=A0A370H1A8_9COXI|nr:ATP-binding cassette domain-containing protein [Aquicella lusitana]RDI48785.1 phospholipid/cholesterol/gamma-HCH transport system ATP-binding protein [Aquicella lusitana]VVC73213.1 putative ABC transporter ATP-binding protein [Aquicella lusitana]